VLGAEFIKDKNLDPLKYGSSFLLYEMTHNLIKHNRTEAW